MSVSVALTTPHAAGPLCFHCGDAIAQPGRWASQVDGTLQPMCCAGCQAVTDAIVAAGLQDYYRTRSGPAAQVDELPPDLVPVMPVGIAPASDAPTSSNAIYDEPEVQARFVRPSPSGDSEAGLLVEGLRCGACVWLVERQLMAQPGVKSVRVDLASERAQLRYDPTMTPLSTVLDAAARVGYRMRPFDAERRELALRKAGRDSFQRMFIAGLGMMQVMMYAYPAYITDAGDIEPQWEALLRWASLLLTVPVIFYSAQPFFAGAWRDLKARSPGMDVPVAVALGAAFAASVHATFTGRGEVWFDSVTMFVFLLLAARHLEGMARRRSARTLDALSAGVPDTAERLRPAGAAEAASSERVPASRLVPGDLFRVSPGERIAVDGELLDAETTIDRALLTGESTPVPMTRGDVLPGGAINTGHPVVLRALRTAADSTISTIERLAERAAASRPRFASLTGQVARWFVAALIGFAIVVWIGWMLVDPQRAGPIAISVLVVSCPCALSLATPAALAAGNAAALRAGLLCADTDLLLAAATVDDVVLDKTGTLTQGHPELASFTPLRPGGSTQDLLALAAALETGQPHPVAIAIRQAAGVGMLPAVQDARTIPGAGVQGTIDGQRWRLGNLAFAGTTEAARTACSASASPPDTNNPLDLGGQAATPMAASSELWLADEQGPVARLVVRDRLRHDARPLVEALRAQGVAVHLLSGDGQAAVARVADALGIASRKADVDPAGKVAAVRALQAQGRRVMMVGDGINDAPVLAAADVSVAVGAASALARTSASVVLLGDRLSDLLVLRNIAKDTRRILRQNLAWAMIYNATAIPAAAAGWVPPLVAAIGMSASSLLVAVNALRLLPARRAQAASPQARRS